MKHFSKITWVYLSGFAFIISILLALLLILLAPRLTEYGISKSFFFIVLIPVGLSASAFLFGAMKSYASYSGSVINGKLQLSGPVVIFCLTILGGFFFAEPETTFGLTIRFFTEQPSHEIINHGSVYVDLGSQRMRKDINSEGEVKLTGIPASLKSKKIEINPSVEGYELINTNRFDIPRDYVLNIELTKKYDTTNVRGTVLSDKGNYLEGVVIDFASGAAETVSNAKGIFEAAVPASEGRQILVTAMLKNKIGYREYITVQSIEPITIVFDSGVN